MFTFSEKYDFLIYFNTLLLLIFDYGECHIHKQKWAKGKLFVISDRY